MLQGVTKQTLQSHYIRKNSKAEWYVQQKSLNKLYKHKI